MTKLLIIKEKLRKIYSSNSMYIISGIKFVVSLLSLLIMNYYIGYMAGLQNPVVSIMISAICSVLPINVIVVIISLTMILNMYGIAAEIAIVAVLMYIVMYIFYFRFSTRYGYVLLLMPILFFLKIPFIMPLIIGASMSPAAIVAMIFGTIVFYMMQYGSEEAVLIVNGMSDSGLDKASSFVSRLLDNKEMIVMILAFTIAALLVYGIRKMSIDHSVTIGIIVGGILESIIILCATYVLEIDGIFKIWMVCVFTLVSISLMYILQFFILAVDYSRTEYTQFEDDDYYYYVKAVPKIKVTATDVKVKHINVKRTRRH